MGEHTCPDDRCFRTVNGEKVVLNLNKSHGCLFMSLKSRRNVFSYKNAAFLVFVFCAIVLSSSLFYKALMGGLSLTYLLWEMLFRVSEEKLLLVNGLGYQISKKFVIRSSTTFIPYERVQTVFINEVILRHRVIYILSLMVQEDGEHPKLVALFEHIMPKLDCLEVMYRSIKRFEDS